MSSFVDTIPTPRGWLARRKRPWLLLAGVVLLLYAPSLRYGLAIDDLRAMRVFREYHAGQRAELGLYRFLPGGDANRAEREAGRYPWWITDELRYQHLRIVSERVLYAQYLLFGESVIGYRLVSLGLYLVGVLLVLDFFRRLGAEEHLARWGALAFAVAAGHAMPVVFVSAQCDVIALVLAGGALGLFVRYLRGGWAGCLPGALLLYGLGLFAKEMVLPVAALPLILGWMLGGAAVRRGLAASFAAGVLGIAWLAMYAAGGFGSNALAMLDPLHTPGAYFAMLPGRAVLLWSTWLIPVSPFLFILHHDWSGGLIVYGAIGAGALAAIFLLYRRWFRGRRDVWGMALWVLAFIPLLACTAPDDRVMILPSIAFAYLTAAWLARPGRARGRWVPLVLFVIWPAVTVPAASFLMEFMEQEAQQHLRQMRAGFGREPQTGDCVFFVNATRNFETLFAQDRLEGPLGESRMRVAILCDVAQPTVTAVDEYTLRIEAHAPPLFSSYLGQLGTPRERPWHEGQTVTLPEFAARIAQVEDGAVTAVELHFAQPLRSDHYRFFWSDPNGPPVIWRAAKD